MTDRGRQTQDLEALAGLKARYWRCVDRQDWDGAAACFTNSGVLDYPDRICSGREAIRAYLKKTLESSPSAHAGTRCEMEVVGGAGAVGTWEARVSMSLPGRSQRTLHVIYEDDYTKEEDGWRMQRSKMRTIPG